MIRRNGPSSTHCNQIEGMCVCELLIEHDGPHQCACGGSWQYAQGEFQIVSWPGENLDFTWGQDAGVPPEQRLYS